MRKTTLLHEAILRGDKDTANKIIDDDIQATDGQTIINVYSQCKIHISSKDGHLVPSKEKQNENTALLLAIKLGLISIALKILEHPKIDVNLKDIRGLTALHWAAVLRQDFLIKKLCTRGANASLITSLWFPEEMLGFQELHLLKYNGISALGVYERPVSITNFFEYHHHARTFFFFNTSNVAKLIVLKLL